MSDPGSLLATLAQSSAAIVAIVGGFLVSRLVALSSEREGLRRQLRATRDRLIHVRDRFDVAHEYRLENSVADFTGWMLPKIVEATPATDLEQLLADNIPRGSSIDEMRPVFDDIRRRVDVAAARIKALLQPTDDSDLDLDDLIARGLELDESDEELYLHMIDGLKKVLPSPALAFGSLPTLNIDSFTPYDSVTDNRRLDESIREEQQLAGELRLLEAEEQRIHREVEAIGRPKGVVAAITILAAYSVVGILVPLIVMSAEPEQLASWQSLLLIGLFTAGLVAVLGYCLWYWRSLDGGAE